MRIAIGADRAGFDLKECLTASLRELGYQVMNVGTYRPGVWSGVVCLNTT